MRWQSPFQANCTLQHNAPSQPVCSQEPKNTGMVMKLLSEDVEGAKEEGFKWWILYFLAVVAYKVWRNYVQCVCIYFFIIIYFNWRLITLQYCSGFCHMLTWISHGYTCVPHPELPSHLHLLFLIFWFSLAGQQHDWNLTDLYLV